MNKKKLISLSLVVIMIAILSFGTLAWFSDSDDVTNKFLVAGSEDSDPNEIFSVDVWEESPDGDGDGEPDKDQDGLTYENILPGGSYAKVAHVENTGSYDQYIRVQIEISDAFAWALALGDQYSDATLLEVFGGFDQSKWSNITTESLIDGDAGLNEIRITMYYNEILEVSKDVTVFETVNIPTSLTQQQAANFGADGTPGFTINVTAEAVQTENVGVNTTNDVCDAYEAFAYVAAN